MNNPPQRSPQRNPPTKLARSAPYDFLCPVLHRSIILCPVLHRSIKAKPSAPNRQKLNSNTQNSITYKKGRMLASKQVKGLPLALQNSIPSCSYANWRAQQIAAAGVESAKRFCYLFNTQNKQSLIAEGAKFCWSTSWKDCLVMLQYPQKQPILGLVFPKICHGIGPSNKTTPPNEKAACLRTKAAKMLAGQINPKTQINAALMSASIWKNQG
jgi:hypothetical protein